MYNKDEDEEESYDSSSCGDDEESGDAISLLPLLYSDSGDEDNMEIDSYYPFPSKHFSLLYFLLHSPRAIVSEIIFD